MEDTKDLKFTKQVWLGAFKTFGKILLGLICLWAFLLSVIFALSPMSCAKIFNFMGSTGAEEVCYKFEYRKTGSAASLYNIIIFEQNQGDWQEELYYLNLLSSREDYLNFCEKLDASAAVSVQNKSMLARTANTNSFIINQTVSAMYKSGVDRSSITDYIIKKLKNELAVEHSFATYVSLLISDTSLSENTKTSICKMLLLDEGLLDAFETKCSILEEMLDNEEKEVKQLVIAYSMLSNAKAKYNLLAAAHEEEGKLLEAKANYDKINSIYNKLIK